ncbi:response regulator receiver protein [Richelia sinica FACHB-800]|uniref:Response regulator receiver protein n=1 Tax=Richelia sinica FACHB-800 TaxID=1357546 RepID=A0A975T4J4_9NOST|nr:response regulator [Richelia sinica]MBD2663164.1 response regulator [Richelia sinica FACHB-800]QXE22038.1 response regulator receiver protein [Richelia sinica FACHB-800]
MNNSLGNHGLFQKLHPFSLLAQLSSKQTIGCLRVFTEKYHWSIYLEDGKLTYTNYSDQLWQRLEIHLHRLNPEILNSENPAYQQLRQSSDSQNQVVNADYQLICWLVNECYLTPAQAATLIEELAKEILESFLCLKQGNYQFNADDELTEFPKFCHLDLRELVADCQKQLRQRQNLKSASSSNVIATSMIAAVTEQTSRSIHLTDNQNSYTVACIDDSPAILNSIKHFLNEHKFAVVMINEPLKALIQVIKSKPDLILLDVEMPNLDGYELCSLLRRHTAFKNTPIIMVTGRKGLIDKAKAKIVKASGYLTKPFSRADLLNMVYKHIN